ncbi:germination protein BB [Paenibacillus sp. J31TS4]|uniref:GerAB/ArcD/ProY family transporter n=1 Tax=Paenibacillus sp. J31TS4 TaxID=2807195 RepID=UPI001B053645|nr:GerAB/ArcD/ProY family transporter [Paenibacillus sp. J31TS4]GIP40496.1 germination protein BB [Paenibacillus sp. J31TS4]
MRLITNLQVYMLFSQILFSTTIGFFVSPLVGEAKYMVWVSVILGCLLGLLLAYAAHRLSMRRPNQLFWRYGRDILGKWVHVPLMLFVVLVNLFAAAFILRQLIDFLVQIYLPGTPDWAVAALFGLCVAQAVRAGPLTFFRSGQGLFFFSIAAALTIPLFVTSSIERDMLIAFVTNVDLPGTWNGAITIAGLIGELAYLVYFYPYLAKPGKNTMRALVWAGITASCVILANFIPTILLFGPQLTMSLTYPTLELIRYLRAGAFLENLDPLLIVFWLSSIFFKIGFFLLIAVQGLTHLLGLNDHKPFSYSMAAFMVFLSLIMLKSTAEIIEVMAHGEAAFLMFLGLIPVLYLAVDSLRSFRRNKTPAASDT